MLKTPSRATWFPSSEASFFAGVLCLWVAYIALVAWPVYAAAQHGCFRYYDLGIYAQGIARLHLKDSNPWLSARQLRLFFDHVDPVLWTAVPLRGLLGPMGAALVTETIWILVSVGPIAFGVHAKKVDYGAGLLCACALLFNPMTLAAAQFPVHPTTWAVAPMFACVLALCQQRYRQASRPLVLLMACKEEFAWCALVWGAMLAWGGTTVSSYERRWVGRLWMLAACTWLVGVYVLRPLGGHTAPYPTQLWSGMRAQGLDYWTVRLLDPMLWYRIAAASVGLGPFAWVLWRGAQRPGESVTKGVLCGLGPLVAIRFLGLAWGYQYEACLGAALVAWSMAHRAEHYRPSLSGVVWTLLGLGGAWAWSGTCADAGTQDVSFGHYGHARVQCAPTAARIEALQRGARVMLQDPAKPVLVGQNLAPLVAEHPNLYVLGGPQPQPAMYYHQVWVEVPPMGDMWPLTAESIVAAIDAWRTTPGVHIVIDDGMMFMAEGALYYPANATFRR